MSVNRPFIVQLPVVVHNGVFHSVGVEGKNDFWMPDKFRPVFSQYVVDGPICQVAFACCRQTAVERHLETLGAGMALEILFGSRAWSHRMAA